jgi:hypothetical protein
MPNHVGLDRDVLIFTDRHFTAGGITDGAFPATVLTQGALLVLRDIFFPEAGDQRTTPDEDALTDQIDRAFPGLGRDSARLAAEALVREVPFLRSVAEAPELGPVQVTDYETSDWLQLAADEPVFLPAGTLFQRTAGPHTARFSVGAQSLAGAVRPNSTLAVLNMDMTGVRLNLAERRTSWAPCGACGACGACVLCAEVNYGVAAISTIALVALAATAEEMRLARKAYPESRDRPVPGIPPQPGQRQPLTVVAELDQAVLPLLKIADEAAASDEAGR